MVSTQPADSAAQPKVIIPSKFKDTKLEAETPFSRNDKMRSSFKDQLSKKYKRHGEMASVLQKLQEQASGQYHVLASVEFAHGIRAVIHSYRLTGKKDDSDKSKASKEQPVMR